MWIMLNDAWLSIVADRDDSDYLLVRSRRRGDVDRVFGQGEFEDENADYQFRQFIPRDLVAGAISREVLKVDYDNFKNSVQDDKLHTAYSRVWAVGYNIQIDARNEGRRRRSVHSIVPSSDADIWPPLNCESCGEPLDHCFHAPVIGQPPGECETCWRKGLHGNYEEDSEEEDDAGWEEIHKEGIDPPDFSFEDLEAIEQDDEEACKVADLFARRSIG